MLSEASLSSKSETLREVYPEFIEGLRMKSLNEE